MINKRFKYCMFDGFEDNGESLDNIEVQDLLNEMYNDNVKLKKENNELKKENEDLKRQVELKLFSRRELERRNNELKKTIKEVYDLLIMNVNVFSDEATKHDIKAYIELKQLDNKDAYYMASGIEQAIKLLEGVLE